MRRVAAILVIAALALGVLGAGVGASYLDTATAVQNISVGTFGCQVSSTDSHAVVNGNSVIVNLPDIEASGFYGGQTNYLFDVTVTNTGSIPAYVSWTATPSGTITFQPAGRMGYAFGTSGDPMTSTLNLAAGASHTYAGAIGFMWATLTNDDLGKTASVTYTASCRDTNPISGVAHPSFVGATSGTLTASTAPTAKSVVCPAGTPQAGSYPWVSLSGAGYTWCGTGAGVLFPVNSTAGWPTSGQFTLTTSNGAATVAYTGLTATAFTGVSTVSGTGYAAPNTTATGVAAPSSFALPAFQAGDLAVAMVHRTGACNTQNAQAPAGWTVWGFCNVYPTQNTFVFTKVLAVGDVFSASVAETAVVAVYRHATPGYFTSAGGAAVSIGAITLHATDGSSSVVLLTDAPSATNLGSFTIDGASHQYAGLTYGVADTTPTNIAAWTGGTFAASPSGTAFTFGGELQYAP
jgi:hypothetical protein